MALFDVSKLNANSLENTQRGNFQWKDESRQEVIFVPDENGKFLISI